MKKFIRILSMIMTVIMLCSVLFACTKQTGTDDTAQESVTGDSAQGDRLTLAAAGKSDYVIVRSETAEQWEIDSMIRFRDLFKTVTGITLMMQTDYEGRGSIYTRTPHEIIIGRTNREDEYTVDYTSIGDGYRVFAANERLVIAATCEGGMNAAIEYFFSEFFGKDVSGDELGYVSNSLEIDRQFDHSADVLVYDFLGADVKEYRIVYPADALIEKRYAYYLASVISELTGFTPAVVPDSGESGEYEILMGDTVRSDASAEAKTAVITTTDTKIKIDGGDFFAYEEVINYFAGLKKNGKIKIDKNITVNLSALSGNISGEDRYVYNRSGEYRVMFNNVLWDDTATTPAAERNQYTELIVKTYAPDVVGFQEMSAVKRGTSSGTQGLVALLGELGYEEVSVNVTNTFGINFTPIFYNPGKVTVLDAGYVWYDVQNNPISEDDKNSKSFTWAVFKSVSGERFMVISTHMCTQSDAVRQIQAGQLKSFIDTKLTEYNVPVILGGDFNANMSEASYSWFTGAGFANAQETADTFASAYRGNFKYPLINNAKGFVEAQSTIDDVRKSVRKDGVDRIFTYNATTVDMKVCSLALNRISLSASDHLPLFADFNIG